MNALQCVLILCYTTAPSSYVVMLRRVKHHCLHWLAVKLSFTHNRYSVI